MFAKSQQAVSATSSENSTHSVKNVLQISKKGGWFFVDTFYMKESI